MQAVHASGVIVLLGRGLTGLISKMHVADVPLKNFAKKFTKGDEVKCRVSPAAVCDLLVVFGEPSLSPVPLFSSPDVS